MRTARFFPFLAVALVSLSILAGCHSSDGPGIPLPKAWPRLPIQQYDSMTVVEGLPVEVRVNPSSTWQIVDDGMQGLTVTYPAVGTKIYFTFVKTRDHAERQQVVDIRKQRISLNLNGGSARMLHSDIDTVRNYDAVLIVSKSAVQTPVQLLATMGNYVVTATAFIDNPGIAQAYDSIAPIVRVLQHDMSNALSDISFSSE